jgi:adenylyl-sulfate kinase
VENGYVIWMTGLPGSGKTTIARILENKLVDSGRRVEVLDGDDVRENLSPRLGFSKDDRQIHANRVAYVSKLLSRNGVIAIVGLISPFRDFRRRAREMVDKFVEVYVKCTVDECIERDVKGHLFQTLMKSQKIQKSWWIRLLKLPRNLRTRFLKHFKKWD